MKIADKDIREVELLEDGSSVYEIGPEFDEIDESSGLFHENLAVNMPEDSRKKLSAFLLNAIDEDITARKPWIDAVKKAEKYLGFSLEDTEKLPFKLATRTYDSTFATALIRFYSTIRAELLPQSGPAGYRVKGQSNEEIDKIARKRRDYLNYYLTIVDKPYYSDSERFLLYLGLYGSAFKKVYYDPIKRKPLSRFIMPENFIIDNDCTSILESNRLTHVLHLSKREILLNQQNNIYREVELPYLKSSYSTDSSDSREENKDKHEVDLDAYTKRSLFTIYEVHTYLNLDDFNDFYNEIDTQNEIPLPYIVTIDEITKEVLSIRRNWKEDDEDKERVNYFVQYNYIQGFGIYGLGLAHLLGSNAITLTRILRQQLDAAALKNFPGGLRAKGLRPTNNQNNELIAGPGEFIEVDSGNVPLAQAFMPFPYSEPSGFYREMMLGIIDQTERLGSTSELGMLDSKAPIATGTAIAMIEDNNRIQSAVFRSIHVSLSQELQLIDQILKDTLEEESFNFGDQTENITNQDFIDEVEIIPISDPSVNSNTQRIMKAEAMMATAQQFPEMYNMREINRMYFQAQGVDDKDIEKILKPEPKEEEILPVNPVSEIMNVLLGKPVKAEISQNHAAHILCLAVAAKRPEFQENEKFMGALQALITEHQAFQYYIEMQQLLGVELPPLDQIQDPEVQNAIALALAERLEETGATQVGQEEEINQNALLMADIQQKAEETAAKERIATQKTETDIFKAQLDFEKEKAKIESNEDIAELKSETELIKHGVNNEY